MGSSPAEGRSRTLLAGAVAKLRAPAPAPWRRPREPDHALRGGDRRNQLAGGGGEGPQPGGLVRRGRTNRQIRSHFEQNSLWKGKHVTLHIGEDI